MSTNVKRLALEGNNQQLAQLCGPLDENLKQISQAFGVAIGRRGNNFEISGDQAAEVASLLSRFHALAQSRDLSLDEVQLGIVEARANLQAKQTTNSPSGDYQLRTRRSDLKPRTPRQADYIDNILKHDITFGTGPAGTGKTWLAVACAIDALERDNVQRLILTRPAVEAGERLGFLPGDLAQKVDPYLRPLYDALYDLMGFDKVQRLFEKQTIEIAPLAYMRGRTLNNAFVILDEAQNTTPEQMKMFLTRIGFGSKAVITGDPSQVDLPRGQTSGMSHATRVLADVQGIAMTVFTSRDVVRHPLVARIVDAYDKDTAQNP
ncbi:MAG: PhoH family protein [Burkholderiaceae bacterium]|nr:PhoH family protein [Burkholderiaceae bacterium]